MTALDALPFGMGVASAAILGAIFGSYSATLVLRLPASRSLMGRSSCDTCGRELGVRDLVPLLSARILRGRCRHCGASIDRFHERVELGSALIGAAALATLPGMEGWLWALFGWMMLPLALLDARHFWLPDRLSLFLGAVGLVIAGPLLDTALLDRWIAAVAGGAILALLAWAYRKGRGSDGMGGGDPKLVAAIGAWIGWQALPLMLLLAAGAGIIWALTTPNKGDQPLAERRVPFGAFACAAAWAAVPLWLLISAR